MKIQAEETLYQSPKNPRPSSADHLPLRIILLWNKDSKTAHIRFLCRQKIESPIHTAFRLKNSTGRIIKAEVVSRSPVPGKGDAGRVLDIGLIMIKGYQVVAGIFQAVADFCLEIFVRKSVKAKVVVFGAGVAGFCFFDFSSLHRGYGVLEVSSF